MLEHGKIYQYEGKRWYCGLVNPSRARLDPLTGSLTSVSPNSGRTVPAFTSYGTSVNVSPSSPLDEVEDGDLTEGELIRLDRLILAEGEHSMSPVAAPPVTGNPATAAKTAEKAGLKEKNAERLAKLKEAKEAKAKEREAARATKKAERAAAAVKDCVCGCGEKTKGSFFPGHDARFKGWMLQIERGKAKKEELLKPEVIAKYKWVKTEKGQRTTTDYKGEPHSGYDTAATAE